MDTAPTGHTLLLLDATGAYHREVARQMGDACYTTPMMLLQDPKRTKALIVTPGGNHPGAGSRRPAKPTCAAPASSRGRG